MTKNIRPGSHWSGSKHAVLSFDVDGETAWIGRGFANLYRPGILSQGAYGPKVGVPRILEFLARRGLVATFFIPGWIAERYSSMVREIRAEGHEVGHHGYMHERCDPRLPHVEHDLLRRGIDALVSAMDERPSGYRAPFWDLTPSTLAGIVSEGFLYSSNLMDADGPYVHRLPEGRLVEIPVEWMLDDGTYYQYPIPGKNLASNAEALDITLGEFDGLRSIGGLAVFTFHPQITGRPYRMHYLESIVDHVLAAGVTFHTCHEIASEILSRETMQT